MNSIFLHENNLKNVILLYLIHDYQYKKGRPDAYQDTQQLFAIAWVNVDLGRDSGVPSEAESPRAEVEAQVVHAEELQAQD